MRAPSFLLLVFLLVTAGAARAQGPVSLPTTNGFGAAGYDVEGAVLADFRPAIYQDAAPGEAVPDLLYDAYVGLRLDDQVTWLRDVPVLSTRYVPGTNVIEVVQALSGRTVTTRWWAPWAWEAPAFAFWVTVEGALLGDQIVSLQNLHLGRLVDGGRVGAEETRLEPGDTVRESGERATVLHAPLRPPSGIAAPPQNPFQLASRGEQFPPAAMVEARVTDHAVVGFQWDLSAGRLEGGAVVGVPPAGGQPPVVTLEAELAQWRAWTDALTLPVDDDLTRQQAAFLRMGQVRMPGAGRGQIVAGLAEGANLTWVRDLAYAAAALARIGALEEAWAALAFLLQADAGYYQDYVGRPYLLSVTRYFGNGREESDLNRHGPNMEWDGFGLFLWSLGRWQAAGGDVERLRADWPRIRTGVLEVLQSLVDEDLGLLQPDSSIWERHWEGGNLEDGQRQRFAYSSIVAAAGLCEAARLAELLGEDGDRWRRLAHRLRDGVEAELVGPDGVLAASYEQLQRGSGYLDLAVAEAFTLGLLPADGDVARATWAAFDASLRIGPERGFLRNDDEGVHDVEESVFTDLRSEVWRRAAGLPGADLLAWLRGRAEAGVLPKLLDRADASLAGPAPMLGTGAGAWLLALDAAPETFCERPVGPPPDAALPPPPPDGGPSPRDAAVLPPQPDARPVEPDAGRVEDDAALTHDARVVAPDGAPVVDVPDGLPLPQDGGGGSGAAESASPRAGGGDGGGCGVGGSSGPGGRWLLLEVLLAWMARSGSRRWRR